MLHEKADDFQNMAAYLLCIPYASFFNMFAFILLGILRFWEAKSFWNIAMGFGKTH
jgi:hypothetical protein